MIVPSHGSTRAVWIAKSEFGGRGYWVPRRAALQIGGRKSVMLFLPGVFEEVWVPPEYPYATPQAPVSESNTEFAKNKRETLYIPSLLGHTGLEIEYCWFLRRLNGSALELARGVTARSYWARQRFHSSVRDQHLAVCPSSLPSWASCCSKDPALSFRSEQELLFRSKLRNTAPTPLVDQFCKTVDFYRLVSSEDSPEKVYGEWYNVVVSVLAQTSLTASSALLQALVTNKLVLPQTEPDALQCLLDTARSLLYFDQFALDKRLSSISIAFRPPWELPLQPNLIPTTELLASPDWSSITTAERWLGVSAEEVGQRLAVQQDNILVGKLKQGSSSKVLYLIFLSSACCCVRFSD